MEQFTRQELIYLALGLHSLIKQAEKDMAVAGASSKHIFEHAIAVYTDLGKKVKRLAEPLPCLR